MRPDRVLPASLRPLFWDYRGRRLTLGRDRDFVVRRVLAEGGWSAIRALRQHVEDAAIREILVESNARGLSPARIRFWQLLLDLPTRPANAWVRAARDGSWEKRRQA